MKKIVCEACGHVNPEGTILCGSCGKPLNSNDEKEVEGKTKLLNMRYDGSARRSQTYNKSIIDKVWNFFSSVKVGIWLIVIVLVASSLGTIFPQVIYIPTNVIPAEHYRDQYGIFGQIYYQLGFHDLYQSWWYILLLALLGISLVVASIDRFVPLYKALKMQKPKRHESFLKRQRLFSETAEVSEQDKQKVMERLKKHRYKITEENGHVLAEKNRFSRWGPYVNHIGLIIFLIGASLRFLPFMYIDQSIWVREGETVEVPATDREYYVENIDFKLEVYDQNDERYKEALELQGQVPSNFQTDVILYKNTQQGIVGQEPELEEVKEASIRVNHPLKFEGLRLYQSSYQLNEFSSMSFKIHRTEDSEEESLGDFTINLVNPEQEYQLDNGFRVTLEEFYPDYYLDEGQPRSQSNFPRNPAFVFFVYPPDETEPEISFAGIGKNIPASDDNEYKLGLTNFEVRDVTGLTLKKDYTLPIIALGGIIFMIGVVQGLYWYHRRIWLHPKDNGLWIAAHTNKNWYGMKTEVEKIIKDTSINNINDQEQEG
ncbi:cytochrome c biogenesis protein ResB [Radiobacillus sp. PE A8.2]|uniref:cytochrome c biogenesis protein ResB n=1 Tax=Radiobacillus sp. PE A8.2 TaxID=3380349 RepID=UPI00388EE355